MMEPNPVTVPTLSPDALASVEVLPPPPQAASSSAPTAMASQQLRDARRDERAEMETVSVVFMTLNCLFRTWMERLSLRTGSWPGAFCIHAEFARNYCRKRRGRTSGNRRDTVSGAPKVTVGAMEPRTMRVSPQPQRRPGVDHRSVADPKITMGCCAILFLQGQHAVGFVVRRGGMHGLRRRADLDAGRRRSARDRPKDHV